MGVVRRPRNVMVFPFRRDTGTAPLYALFRRADDGNWQCVSGGVEDDEDLAAAARRETAEETGFAGAYPLYELAMVSGVEKTCFAASARWPAGLYIVPKHYFAMDVSAERTDVVLSPEHRQVRWCGFDEARATLRYDDDRTALWELDARLTNGDLPAATR